MTIESAQVSVSTVAVSLADGGSNGVRVKVANVTGTAAYLGGGTAVVGTTGYQLPGSSSLETYVDAREKLYAITASGTTTIHVLRGGV